MRSFSEAGREGVYGYLVVVGLLWGSTNPFMKIGSKKINEVDGNSKIAAAFNQIVFLITNWKYTIPLLLNQVGSIIFFFVLRSYHISLCVPVANSMAFLFTILTSYFLGERKLNNHLRKNLPLRIIGTIFGVICVTCGIGFLVVDKLRAEL